MGGTRLSQYRAVHDPTEWETVVDRLDPDDLYAKYAYNAASSRLEVAGTEPVLLDIATDDGEAALPLLMRPLRDRSGYDATSAYGYGGPIVRGEIDAQVIGEGVQAWAEDAGVIATFLRFNPLSHNERWAPAGMDVVCQGQTVAWRVGAERGELMIGMTKDRRKSVRQAERAGLVTMITRGPTNIDSFLAVYELTLCRLNAQTFYHFADCYWETLLRECRDNLLLVEGHVNGEIVASALMFASGQNLYTHLSGTTDAGREIGAAAGCDYAAALWAQSQGITTFHLGGGLGAAADSLFDFKHRYDPSNEPLIFHIGKVVHDVEQYRALAGSDSTEGYFPPWRKPQPVVSQAAA